MSDMRQTFSRQSPSISVLFKLSKRLLGRALIAERAYIMLVLGGTLTPESS